MPAKNRERGTVATQRLRKVECPGCGCILYMSRKWIAGGTPTCSCGVPMVSVDHEREQRELAEWRERDARAAIRNRGGLNGTGSRGKLAGEERKRCEHCAAFLPGDNASAECASCGHAPDPAVGHRQHHQTPAQQQRARRAKRTRDPMPF